MSGYEWKPCNNFNIPNNALKCGTDLDGSDIYVGLTTYNGDQLPCKVVPKRKEAYISYDGTEIKISNFTVLCQKSMLWVQSSNGNIPAGAITAGRTTSGETLYVGRTFTGKATVVGKVQPSQGCLYVPYDGKEVSYKTYEVLTLN